MALLSSVSAGNVAVQLAGVPEDVVSSSVSTSYLTHLTFVPTSFVCSMLRTVSLVISSFADLSVAINEEHASSEYNLKLETL